MSAMGALLECFRDYLGGRDDVRLSRFTEGFDWAMARRDIAPRSLPVAGYLSFVPAADTAEGRLLAALYGAGDVLCWRQTYGAGDFGPAFLDRYGWVELFGTRGHFQSGEMAGGFLALGPEIFYPDHHHVAEEIYIPLTAGSLWSRDGGAFAPRAVGEIIHHPSDIRHAMRTREHPLVALYLWRGGPLDQKSTISGSRT